MRVGRLVVFELENALVHHGQGELGAGRGGYFHGLPGLGAAGGGRSNDHRQARIGFFDGERQEAAGHGEGQAVLGGVGAHGGGGHVHVGHVLGLDGDFDLGRLAVGAHVEMVEHVGPLHRHENAAGEGRFQQQVGRFAGFVLGFVGLDGHLALVVHLEGIGLGIAVAVGVKPLRNVAAGPGPAHAHLVFARINRREAEAGFGPHGAALAQNGLVALLRIVHVAAALALQYGFPEPAHHLDFGRGRSGLAGGREGQQLHREGLFGADEVGQIADAEHGGLRLHVEGGEAVHGPAGFVEHRGEGHAFQRAEVAVIGHGIGGGALAGGVGAAFAHGFLEARGEGAFAAFTVVIGSPALLAAVDGEAVIGVFRSRK